MWAYDGMDQQSGKRANRYSCRLSFIVCTFGLVQGINVRNRAKELFILITDDRRLTDEREKVGWCVQQQQMLTWLGDEELKR